MRQHRNRLISIGAAVGLVIIYEKASIIEADLNVFVSAAIGILLGLVWSLITRWLMSWLFD